MKISDGPNFTLNSRADLPNILTITSEWNTLLMGLLDPREYEDFFRSIIGGDDCILDISMEVDPANPTKYGKLILPEIEDISTAGENTSDCIYPDRAEEIRLFLGAISVHADKFQQSNPQRAFISLWSIYERYRDSADIRGSIEYMGFLGVLVSCAGTATRFQEGDIVAGELRELLIPYLGEIFPGTPSDTTGSSPVNFWDTMLDGNNGLSPILTHYPAPGGGTGSIQSQAYQYGEILPVTLDNLAKFYGKTGAYDRALAAAQIGYEVAHRLSADIALFHLAITQIVTRIHMRKAREPATVILLDHAKKILARLIEIYGGEGALGKTIAQEGNTRLRIIEIRILSERIVHGDLSDIMELMEERDRLLGKGHDALSVQDQAILVQIQIVLFIAIDNIFRDSRGLSTALANYPDAIVYIIKSGKRVRTLGLDIQKYAQTENRGLLLGSMVSLFSHLTKTIISDASAPPEDIKLLELKHMMFEIYRTIEGIAGSQREYLQRQGFYSLFISAAKVISGMVSGNPGIDEGATLSYLEDNLLMDAFHTDRTGPRFLGGEIYPGDVWGAERIMSEFYGGKPLDMLHTGKKVAIDSLTEGFLADCISDSGIIMFPDESWCSIVEAAVGSYTIRFRIKNGTVDRLPEFEGICLGIGADDGTFHFDKIVCKHPEDRRVCEEQLRKIHARIQPHTTDIRYDADDILGQKLLYRDTFGTIYDHGKNSKGEQVFIVKTKKGEGDFRCEMNTYIEDGKNTVYVGSMLNSQGGHDLRAVLSWIAKIFNALDGGNADFEIKLTRDTSHGERSLRMSSVDFFSAFKYGDRCGVEINEEFRMSFLRDFFGSSEEILSVH